jgi:hypothetical protein
MHGRHARRKVAVYTVYDMLPALPGLLPLPCLPAVWRVVGLTCKEQQTQLDQQFIIQSLLCRPWPFCADPVAVGACFPPPSASLCSTPS